MQERRSIALNKMLGYLKDYKRESVLAPLFKMLEATFDLFVPLVMADIVNIGIAAHDFHYILVRCGILLLLAMIGLACSLTAQYFSAKAAVGYSTALRHALFEHIQTLSFTEMDTLGTSTLITRMTSDVNQVQSGLNLFLRLFLRSPFVVIGAMVMAFTVNSRAALIFVVTIPLLSVVVFGIMAATRPLYKTVQNRLDRVLGLTRENLTGVRVVRAFDKEKSEVERFENTNDLLTRMQLHVGHISALMNPLTYVLINIAIVALLYVGSIEINVGGMASGDVIALVNYMNQILVELVKLANLIVQVSKALACAGRVQAVLDTTPGMAFPEKLLGEVPAEKSGDAVRFEHVSLTYAGAGAPSLSDISFTAKRGQTIGVIGGTGSGKSTTLYSTLTNINNPNKNIITVEDPVEYRIEGVNQVAVNNKAGLTFANGLRSILRQDPNIIMVGEIRDVETARISIHAALTGHLVFSTLHTNDAAGAITRLIDMGVEPFLVASALRGVVAQRLVRRICPHCKETYAPDAAERAYMGIALDEEVKLYKGAGCGKCNFTGYAGRMAIHEVLPIIPEMKELILKNAPDTEIFAAGRSYGVTSMKEDGIRKVLDGETTASELLRVAYA